MQEEQPSLYETSYEFSTAIGSGASEQDQAAFFEQNQHWLLGEVEQYLTQQKEEAAKRKDETENKDDKKDASDSGSGASDEESEE